MHTISIPMMISKSPKVPKEGASYVGIEGASYVLDLEVRLPTTSH